MRKSIWLTGVAATFLSGAALAQTAPAAAPQAPAADAAQQGVLVFEPAFFADSRPDTAADMIQRLPGFGLDGGDNSTRGFAGAAGNVLIDGDRPSTKSDNLFDILRRIPAGSVERIELIRGGAPGIDMQGQPVVANIVRKRAAQVQRTLEVNTYVYPDGYLGPLIKGQFSRSEGDERLEASFSATSDRTDGTGDGYRRRYSPSGTLIQDADLELYDLFRNLNGTAAMQRPFAGGRLRVNGLLGYNTHRWEVTTDVVSGAGVDEFSEQDVDSVNGELGLTWNRTLGPRTELELTALQRYGADEFLGGLAVGGDEIQFGNDSTAGESIGRAVLRFRQNDRWAFESGGEIAYNFLDSEASFSENGVPQVVPGAAVKVEELRGEAFGQATWRPTAQLTVEAGLRVEVSEISQSGDNDSAKSFVYPKPRLQLTWTPAAGHQFRFRYEREVGQLDFGDFVASSEITLGEVTGGNPDLEPFQANTFEAVYERRFWGEGVVDFTLRHADIEDIVDTIPLVGGFDAVGNIGEGTQDFFQVRLTLPLDKLGLANARLQARTSWAESNLTDPVTGEERRFSGQVPFGCGVSFNHDLDGGRWSYGFDHGCNVDDFYQYRTREVRYFEGEPFVTIYGQWKPAADLTVRLDVGNATDREQRRYRDIYAGSRDTAPLAGREEQGTRMSPWLFIQVRKTL
jgi:hypothetical protein